MKLRYDIEKVHKNGQHDSTSQEFESDAVIIGRGGSATLLLDSPSVAAEHAKLSERDGGLVVEDLGSLSGTKVNDNLVKTRVLKPNDVIKLGERSLKVSKDESWWVVTEEREEKDLESVEDKVTRLAAKFKTWPAIYSIKGLSLVLSIVVAAVYFALPIAGGSRSSWSAGEVTANHKMIENKCVACHQSAFHSVSDSDCQTCHSVTAHAAAFKSAGGHLNERACVDCHAEHSGDAALIQKESKMCVSCHSEIAKIHPESKVPAISAFSNHPEFRVTVWSAAGEGPQLTSERVSLDSKGKVIDRSGVKLNHKVHLEENIRGAKGRVTMQCRDCHQASADLKSILPISFERHCQACHPLGFDDKLPGVEVPHGDPDVVYNFMFAEYAKLFLASAAEVADKEDFNIRRKPGYQAIAKTEEAREFTRAQIQADTRISEKYLFTRTACQLCHVVAEKQEIDERSKYSRFQVLKPRIPERWMPASTFDHGAHEEVRCESCHAGVRDSKSTEDVLLPGIKDCKGCHKDTAHAGNVGSECIVCHSYHDPLPVEAKSKKGIDEILKAVSTIG